LRNLGHKLSFRRIIALLMIAVALFPVISTTDDEVRYAFLHKGSDSSNSVLNALLDSLDAVQVTHSVAATECLAVAGAVPTAEVGAASHVVIARLGRAPPIS